MGSQHTGIGGARREDTTQGSISPTFICHESVPDVPVVTAVLVAVTAVVSLPQMETSAEQVSASRFSMRRSSLKFSRSQRPLGMLPSTSQRIVLLSILVCFGSNVEYVSGFAFSFGRHPGPGDWAQLSTAALDGPLPVLSRASAFATSCVPIPRNMSLCQGLEYSKMRLPNLLEHDTIDEALEQSASWVHLYKLRCHADTQKFLCSLFAPVCLETPIFPCRSLCEAVRGACESAMLKYGYPWPDMVSCDKFPEDDMCVTAGDRDDGGQCFECVCVCVCVF